LISTGASGAIPRNDIARMDAHAKRYYEEIRKRASDVRAIAQNTGLTEEDIMAIKQHIFFNEYALGGKKPARFDPDYDMAVSWQRLIEGKSIQEMDLVMLKHEMMEYQLMSEKCLSYREAHDLTEQSYNYAKYVNELNAREGMI